MVGWAGKAEETELADLHARVELDRQIRHVGEFQGDVPAESRIDESRSGVGEQPQPSQGRLAFQTSRNVVGELNEFIGGAQHEFAWMQNKGLVVCDGDQTRQFRLVFRRINHRVTVVLEDRKSAIQAHVNAGWLHHNRIPRREFDLLGSYFGEDVMIGKKHERNLPCEDAIRLQR